VKTRSLLVLLPTVVFITMLYIPKGQCATDTVTVPLKYLGYGQLGAVALSPDGTKFLTGSADRKMRLWNLADGALIQTFFGHTAGVFRAVFSPDGSRAVSLAGDNSGIMDSMVIVWDVASGLALRTFCVPGWQKPSSVTFSPDGLKILIGSYYGTPTLWDIPTGDSIMTFSKENMDLKVNAVAFSPDGTKILTSGYRSNSNLRAILWNTATGDSIRSFSSKISDILCITFSPDGKKMLAGDVSGAAILWDVATGDSIRTFSRHTGAINSVSFSPDGSKILTASEDATARLWDAATGAVIRTFFGHTWGVSRASLLPDGKKVFTGSPYDNTVRLFDAASGSLIRTFTSHSQSVYSAAFSADGKKVVTGSGYMEVTIWDVAAATQLLMLNGNTSGASSVAFSPDGSKLLTGGGGIRYWDAATGVCIRTIAGRYYYSPTLSPDGKKVFALSDDNGAVIVLDIATGDTIQSFKKPDDAGKPAAITRDCKKVLYAPKTPYMWDKAKLWDLANSTIIQTFSGGYEIHCAAFSQDESKMVTATTISDSILRPKAILWNVATGDSLMEFSGHADDINSVAFSPDGKTVLTGSGEDNRWQDNTARLWNAATGKVIRIFSGYGAPVTAVSYSPDGKTALSASKDGTIMLWDISFLSIQTPQSPAAYKNGIFVRLKPDNTLIISGRALIPQQKWSFTVYTPAGRIVARTSAGYMAGGNSFTCSLPHELGNGTYLYRLVNGNAKFAGTFMVMK